ncbi:MAG: ATP-binding protein, partial [Chloroflexota bacterium]
GRFGTLNPQQEKYITRIKQTSSKLHELVKSLVDLAWIEAGMPLAHVPVRLDEIIQKAVRMNSHIAHKHKVGVAVSLQTPLPLIMGDPVRLQMVIQNLLHNAVIYSAPESNVAIHGWGDVHEMYCSVADRGLGIADTELELVFDRMYRSSDERVREIPGGGLGLTVARTIIKRHGGDIWASSNLDTGSTFTFVLPVVGA